MVALHPLLSSGSSQPCRCSCWFFLNSIFLWHQHKWFNGGIRLLRLHNKPQQKRWQDIMLHLSHTVLVSSQPGSIQLYQNNALCADKTSQHQNELWDWCRSIVAIVHDCCYSTSRNALCGSWISWSFLLLGLDSIVWDHMMYSCLSTRGICVETTCFWLCVLTHCLPASTHQ